MHPLTENAEVATINRAANNERTLLSMTHYLL
jgi:hypothetical protein